MMAIDSGLRQTRIIADLTIQDQRTREDVRVQREETILYLEGAVAVMQKAWRQLSNYYDVRGYVIKEVHSIKEHKYERTTEINSTPT